MISNYQNLSYSSFIRKFAKLNQHTFVLILYQCEDIAWLILKLAPPNTLPKQIPLVLQLKTLMLKYTNQRKYIFQTDAKIRYIVLYVQKFD